LLSIVYLTPCSDNLNNQIVSGYNHTCSSFCSDIINRQHGAYPAQSFLLRAELRQYEDRKFPWQMLGVGGLCATDISTTIVGRVAEHPERCEVSWTARRDAVSHLLPRQRKLSTINAILSSLTARHGVSGTHDPPAVSCKICQCIPLSTAVATDAWVLSAMRWCEGR